MYYILDKDGNKITEFRTTIDAAEAFESVPNAFTVCVNNISNILRGKKPKNGILQVRGLSCVRKKDYDLYESEIRWLLTKNDIFIINRNGDVCGTFKTQNGLYRLLSQSSGNISSSNIIYSLNKVDSEVYGYRIATREHYINILKERGVKYFMFKTVGELKKALANLDDEATIGCTTYDEDCDCWGHHGCEILPKKDIFIKYGKKDLDYYID